MVMMLRSSELTLGEGLSHLGDHRASGHRCEQPRCFTDLLDRIIIDHGFSVRKAKKIRKAIFDAWARALRRGAVVETPLGEIKAVLAPKRRARFNRVNRKLELVTINQRERRIVFTPWPWLIEEVPTLWYQEHDARTLEELGRKPWAMNEAEHTANVDAIKAVVADRAAKDEAERERAASRDRMSHFEILSRSQRHITDFLPLARAADNARRARHRYLLCPC